MKPVPDIQALDKPVVGKAHPEKTSPQKISPEKSPSLKPVPAAPPKPVEDTASTPAVPQPKVDVPPTNPTQEPSAENGKREEAEKEAAKEEEEEEEVPAPTSLSQKPKPAAKPQSPQKAPEGPKVSD